METIQKIRRVSGLILRRPRFALIAFVIIAALVALAYFTLSNKTSEEKARQELAAAVAAVGELMILPEGDEPILANVTDAEALIKQQAFFAGAVNGDQLLLFPKNMKAVIYSPSRNKIINAGPIEQQPQVTVNNPQTPNSKFQASSNDQDSNFQTSPAVLTVEVRNGTGKTGYGATTADQLRAAAGYSVIRVVDASKKDYLKTLVISRAKDDNEKQMASALAGMLGGEVIENLPKGEKSTEADALIIIGGE